VAWLKGCLGESLESGSELARSSFSNLGALEATKKTVNPGDVL